MGFQYQEKHREEYYRDGLTILRGLIPPALLEDLRRETDHGREIARAERGRQAQRLQPVFAHPELNLQVFQDFRDLPALREVVEKVLGPGYEPSKKPGMAVLYEPAEAAWATNWHRDWAHAPYADFEAYRKARTNMRLWNQLNAALYDDHSLWVVPGSHSRDDTPEEEAAFPNNPPLPPVLTPEMSAVQREMTCLNYVRSMPNAVQIVLCAGDVAFYRNSAWHIGSYVPYVKRATVHDGFYCEEDEAWVKQAFEHREAAKAAEAAAAAAD